MQFIVWDLSPGILVNIYSGNGVLHDGTKPLPETMWAYNQISNVLWHLSQWIIITDLKIPISKMRLKLVCWDNFTPSPEIIHLFSSDNSFVCVMAVSNIFLSPSLILLASVHSRATRYHAHVSFVTTPQGGNGCPKNTCCMKSQSHERL